jgi:hypothetical protein
MALKREEFQTMGEASLAIYMLIKIPIMQDYQWN